MAHEKEIVKNVSFFTTARYVAYFFSILTGLLIAKVLGPAEFGVYSALMLIVNYSQYSHLGLINAITKKVPFYRGKKRFQEAILTERIAFTGTIVIITIISFLLILLSFFIRNVTQTTKIGLRIVALVVFFQQLFYFFQNYLRAEKKFSLMGKSTLIYSFSYFVLILLFIFNFDLVGVFFSMFVAYLITTIYFFKKAGFRIKFKLIPAKIFNLFKAGFPLLTMGMMTLLFISIDKIMILKFMNKVDLGYYSFATVVAGIVLFVPQSMSSIIFPYILEKYGEKEEKNKIINYLFQPTFVISYLIPLVIGLVFITAPFAIYYILPAYIPSFEPFKILICSVFFMSLILPSNSFLITLNKERKILLMQAVSIILAVILNYLFIIKGYGITGIAIATAVSYFFYSLFILISSFKHYTNGFFNYVKLFFKLYIPIFYVAFLLLAFNFFPLTGFFIKDFLYVLVKSFLFLIFNIPLIWIVNKRTGVVETFFKMALSKSKKLYK